jgi:hypothetical protein
MTFWIWTFLKNYKCPILISSRISFLGALKNPEEKRQCVSALNMLRKSKGLKINGKIFSGFLRLFGLLDIFDSVTRLNIIIESSHRK